MAGVLETSRSILSVLTVATGQRRELSGIQRKIVGGYSLLIVLFTIVMLSQAMWGMDLNIFVWIHVGLIGSLGFLIYSARKAEDKIAPDSIILSVLLLVCIGYFLVDSTRINELSRFGYTPNQVDTVVLWIVILLTAEGLRRVVGMVMVLLTALAMVYALYVVELPFINLTRTMGFQSNSGLWGAPIVVSATMMIPMFCYSSMFQTSGVANFLLWGGSRLLGNSKGAAAKVTTLASSAYGMVNGGASANVLVTGPFSIPAMVNSGFRPDIAGAFESVASTGGAITPPVMGSVALIVAALTGVPYLKICIVVIPTTVIYYLTLFVQSHLIACRDGIGGMPRMESLPRIEIIKHCVNLILPLIVLIVFLTLKYSVATSFIMGLLAISIMMLITTRGKGWRQVIEGLINGGYNTAYLAFILAIVSVFMEVVAAGALDTTVVSMTQAQFGYALFPSLVVSAVISLLMGMTGNILAAYILSLVVIVPIIAQLGIPPLAAHMFAFYYGNLATITPPVCIACMLVTRFVDVSYWKVGWESIKLSFPVWLLPFYFVYQPELLMLKGTAVEMAIVIVSVTIAMLFLAAAFIGFMFTRLNIIQRLMCGIVFALLSMPDPSAKMLGLVVGAVLVSWQVIRLRAQTTSATAFE